MNKYFKLLDGDEIIGEYCLDFKNGKIVENFLKSLIPFLAAEADKISKPIDYKEYDLYDYYGKSKQTLVAGLDCFFETGKAFPFQVQMHIYHLWDQRIDEYPGYDLNCRAKEVKAGKFVWCGDGYAFKANR